ncbi:MAG: ribosome maturation factor RimM [Rhodothermales bacterium]|jgi:16S rRNA processing protein RimM
MKAGSTPSDEGMILREMGRIVKPHGVVGELKVAPETDDPGRFQQLETVHVGPDEDSTTSFDILSVRLQSSRHGITVLLELEGVSSREAAQALARQRVFANQEDLPPLEDGEFYFSDLIGLTVETLDGDTVGSVVDVFEKPGQDLLVIQRPEGGRVMIPLVPDLVPEIDIEGSVLRIDPIEGLL